MRDMPKSAKTASDGYNRRADKGAKSGAFSVDGWTASSRRPCPGSNGVIRSVEMLIASTVTAGEKRWDLLPRRYRRAGVSATVEVADMSTRKKVGCCQ